MPSMYSRGYLDLTSVREGGDEELDGQQSGAPFGTPLIFFLEDIDFT